MLPEVPEEQESSGQEADDGDIDPMFADAAWVVVNTGHGSTSLQRKLKLGYNRRKNHGSARTRGNSRSF